jgi:hypothetical protein
LIVKRILALFLLLLIPVHASAATMIVDGDGNLKGASGVLILGKSYEVSFVEGSCFSLFDGCQQPAFDFNSSTVFEAGRQLLLQVFVDGPAGSFGSLPGKTSGCANVEICYVLIPVHLFPDSTIFGTGFVANGRTGVSDTYGVTVFPKGNDTSLLDNVTFARFSLLAVPEPSNWLLMLSGFAALGIILRSSGRPTTPRQARVWSTT